MMHQIYIMHRYYNQNYNIDGFHALFISEEVFTQDTVHIVAKLKTRLFKISVTLPIGNYIVSASHIRELLGRFTKDKHLLIKRNLDGKDKMNFDSVLKISAKKVIDLLKKEVVGSKGTQEYLKLINLTIHSYLSIHLNRLQRIYCSWYCIFFIR